MVYTDVNTDSKEFINAYNIEKRKKTGKIYLF